MQDARSPDAIGHQFGGTWTDKKLQILAAYLKDYRKALKKQPFELWYVDAFAGTGYRVGRGDAGSRETDELGLNVASGCAAGDNGFLDGSARIALKTIPPFDRYVFIDSNKDHCRSLESLKAVAPDIADRIRVICGDANEEIRGICNDYDWQYKRAVMFLDPYGLQVSWSTVQAIADTHAVDLWVLFSCSAVTRMIPNDGLVPTEWEAKLNDFFGTDEWKTELFKGKVQPDLFGAEHESPEKVRVERIVDYYLELLGRVFAKVARETVTLRNSKGSPMYVLCFAASNEKGAPIALKIAGHILGKMG